MAFAQTMPVAAAQDTSAAERDRYVTFRGIDFDGNMAAVMEHLNRYIDNPETGNAFWDRFKERLAEAGASATPRADQLLLLHSHVYYMQELFEDHDDEDALAALKVLEEECF